VQVTQQGREAPNRLMAIMFTTPALVSPAFDIPVSGGDETRVLMTLFRDFGLCLITAFTL
jgi:hypothetical protein